MVVLFVCTVAAFAAGNEDSARQDQYFVVASTTWTAAFADLGGLDDVLALAPGNLVHPPEYELTVSDMTTLASADILVYAGYERMIEVIRDAAGCKTCVPVHTDNSLQNVETQAAIISKAAGTETESLLRVASFRSFMLDARQRVRDAGLVSKQVLVHAMQVPLARDLGLNTGATFGPGPVTAAQIADAREKNYELIIDNIHNPVSGPLREVSPESRVVVWRNFPETLKRGALEDMVRGNVLGILKNTEGGKP